MSRRLNELIYWFKDLPGNMCDWFKNLPHLLWIGIINFPRWFIGIPGRIWGWICDRPEKWVYWPIMLRYHNLKLRYHNFKKGIKKWIDDRIAIIHVDLAANPFFLKRWCLKLEKGFYYLLRFFYSVICFIFSIIRFFLYDIPKWTITHFDRIVIGFVLVLLGGFAILFSSPWYKYDETIESATNTTKGAAVTAPIPVAENSEAEDKEASKDTLEAIFAENKEISGVTITDLVEKAQISWLKTIDPNPKTPEEIIDIIYMVSMYDSLKGTKEGVNPGIDVIAPKGYLKEAYARNELNSEEGRRKLKSLSKENVKKRIDFFKKIAQLPSNSEGEIEFIEDPLPPEIHQANGEKAIKENGGKKKGLKSGKK